MTDPAKPPGKPPEDPRGNSEREPEELWLPFPHETAKAYAAFTIYKDMGPERSTTKVYHYLHRDRRTIEKWCRAHEWVRRALAWDVHIKQVQNRAAETEAVAVGKRQAQQGYTIQVALGLIAQEFIRRVQVDPAFLKEMPGDELRGLTARLARPMLSAVNIERLGLGLAAQPEGAEEEAEVSKFKIVLEDAVEKKEKKVGA